jgi:integrase
VDILRQHIDTFGTASDGRIFSSDRGGPVASTAISDVWAEARTLALAPAQAASPLARRPYDLRHAAVSLLLSAGVPPARVAERAGHSVEVLLRVYAKCLDDGDQAANTRIDAALKHA